MNKTQNQFSNSMPCLLCLAIGLTLAAGQQSVGQSATPPKVMPAVAAIEAKIEEAKRQNADYVAQLEDSESQHAQYLKDLEELETRGTSLNVSSESYPEVLKTLHSQRVQLSIDLAGIGARYEAIRMAVKTVVDKQNDDIVKPFKRLVELRQANYDRVVDRAARGSAGAEEKHTAEVELLQSQLQLANALKPSGSLAHLNSQLLDTSLERAENTARLEKANSLFKDVDEYRTYRTALVAAQKKSMDSSSRRESIRFRQDFVKREIDGLKHRLSELEK